MFLSARFSLSVVPGGEREQLLAQCLGVDDILDGQYGLMVNISIIIILEW